MINKLSKWINLRHGLIPAFFLLATLTGCGSGSSSKNSAAPDFTFSASPGSFSGVAGGTTSQITLTETALNGFSGNITITATLPSGFTCLSGACLPVTIPAFVEQMTYGVNSSVAPGTYTILFTATAGSITHHASVSAIITAEATAPTNQTAMVYTEDWEGSFGANAVYDKVHDQIFLCNAQLSEIDVITPKTFAIMERIPVPAPTALDLSLDDSTLYVGTDTQSFFEIDTASLTLEADNAFPEINGYYYPSEVMYLADGTLAILAAGPNSGSQVVIYSPATGKNTSPFSGSYDNLLGTSADRTKLFFTSQNATGNFEEYDTATKTTKSITVPGPAGAYALAVRPDGQGYALLLSSQISFLDANFNLLGTYTSLGSLPPEPIYSPDSTKLYLPVRGSSVIGVLDATTYKFLGQIPAVQNDSALFNFWSWDGQGRLLAVASDILAALDVSMAPTSLPSSAEIINNTLGPNDPATGHATTITGVYLTNPPTVTFNSTVAQDVLVASSNTIDLTAPALSGISQADVHVYFPDGYYWIIPDAYSYQPTVLFTDGNASSTDGGTTLTLYGYGLIFGAGGTGSSVTIGGNSATGIAGDLIYATPYPVPLQYITAKVPAGLKGQADVVVSNALGSTVVKNGFTYAQRSTSALPSGSSPFQLILDKNRNRLLWTDNSLNQLVVYSLTSNAIQQQINLGGTPAGLAITPDGADILVVLPLAAKLEVFDASTLTLLQSTYTPTTSLPTTPLFITALAGQQAFLVSTFSGYAAVPVYEYNIASNTFRLRSDITVQEDATEAASLDGTKAIVGSQLWNSATDTFSSFFPPSTSDTDGGPKNLNTDGSIFTDFPGFYDGIGRTLSTMSEQLFISSEMSTNTFRDYKLNATGSLLYYSESDRIRVFDVRHGALLKTIMLNDTLSPDAYYPFTVDPNGQALYILTASSVTSLQFASDPLSIGVAQYSGTQLTILGSGFAPGTTLQMDGVPIPANVQDSQHIVASLSTLSTNAHTLTVTLPTGEYYTLDNAFDVSN